MAAASPIEGLQSALDAVRTGSVPLANLAQQLRDLQVPAALPPRFAEVLAGLADRIESSSLFGGESCSFSEADLLDAVQAWVDKAAERLGEH